MAIKDVYKNFDPFPTRVVLKYVCQVFRRIFQVFRTLIFNKSLLAANRLPGNFC